MMLFVPTHSRIAAILALSALMSFTALVLADETDKLRAEGAVLSRQAGELAEQMIGPFDAKSTIAPWVDGDGYRSLRDTIASAERLSRALVENDDLRRAGERLRELNTVLTKDVRAFPALDGSSKIGPVLEHIRETLLRIQSLEY